MGCVYSLLCLGRSNPCVCYYLRMSFRAVLFVSVVIFKRGQFRLLADGVSELRLRDV